MLASNNSQLPKRPTLKPRPSACELELGIWRSGLGVVVDRLYSRTLLIACPRRTRFESVAARIACVRRLTVGAAPNVESAPRHAPRIAVPRRAAAKSGKSRGAAELEGGPLDWMEAHGTQRTTNRRQ